MRLIDADKLLKQAWFCDLDHWSGKVVDEDIINEAPTVNVDSKWIRVQNGMPVEYYDYAANCSTSDLVLVVVALNGEKQFVSDDLTINGEWYIHGHGVTHWMPMPGLPKENCHEIN